MHRAAGAAGGRVWGCRSASASWRRTRDASTRGHHRWAACGCAWSCPAMDDALPQALALDTGPARILVVEDEPKLSALLADYLRAAGHEPECVADGRDVLPAWTARRHDLILLDLMLPGLDGLSLCREIRARSSVPILILSARADEADRLLGLELGADDYMAKNPFSPREVMARVKAVLRRS
eukprot:Opistho-2@42787